MSNGENWHYLVVKNLSGLLRGISSNHNSDYYCLNCFHSYRTKNKLNAHKRIYENHDFNNDKVRDHCHFPGKYRGAAHNTCNLRYKIPKNIAVIFHNGSTYDYHFIIKELANEFDGNFECLGENTEKYITFSVPIKKRIDNKNIDITYKIKFIDGFRFMATPLSKLVDNLTDKIHNDKCIKCKSNLCFVRAMNEKLIFKCIDCEKEYEKEFNKELVERFANTYTFCDNVLNKFIMLLRKGVYPYEYIDE